MNEGQIFAQLKWKEPGFHSTRLADKRTRWYRRTTVREVRTSSVLMAFRIDLLFRSGVCQASKVEGGEVVKQQRFLERPVVLGFGSFLAFPPIHHLADSSRRSQHSQTTSFSQPLLARCLAQRVITLRVTVAPCAGKRSSLLSRSS